MSQNEIKFRLNKSIIVSIFTVLVLLLTFNNCSDGFKPLSSDTSADSNLGSNTQSPEEEVIDIPDVPIDPNAGLSLYAQDATVKQGETIQVEVKLNKVHTENIILIGKLLTLQH